MTGAGRLTRWLTTLALGSAGGAAFSVLGFPAAWLSGSAFAVAAASLAGLQLAVPNALRHGTFIFLGAMMGSTATPETLSMLSKWPATLAGLAVSVVGIMTACSVYLERVHGYDRVTARLASIPGALPYVMALAAESRCDQRRIIIIQIFRLVALLLLLPSVMAFFGESPVVGLPHSAHPVKLVEVALLMAGAAAGAALFVLIKAPAPTLFGSMIAGAVLYASGTLSSGVPDWLMLPCFVVIGTNVGTNFAGVDRSLIVDTALAGFGSLLIGVGIALAIAIPVAWLFDFSVAQVWLSYAPGGVDVMTVLALAMGLDPAFVGGHHVVRFLGIGILVPVWVRAAISRHKP